MLIRRRPNRVFCQPVACRWLLLFFVWAPEMASLIVCRSQVVDNLSKSLPTDSRQHESNLFLVDSNGTAAADWPRILSAAASISKLQKEEEPQQLVDLIRFNFTRLNSLSRGRQLFNTSSATFQLAPATKQKNRAEPLVVKQQTTISTNNTSSPANQLANKKISRSIAFKEQQSDVMTTSVSESKRIEQNSECALILKRTYILRKKDPDEWGEKFVFNDIDESDKPQKRVHKADLCIKHSDVDKAIEEAMHWIKFEELKDLDSLDVSERSIAAVGELNLATGLLLTKRFDLSHDEILNALPMIDMSTSKFFWKSMCPKHVRPMSCTKSRYRTITAHCNNLQHPHWGASKTPYSRYLPPDYADGLSAPRAAQDGKPLPSARLITSQIHVDADEPSHDYSILFADWGQLLNHDVTRVAVGQGKCNCASANNSVLE